jgi:heparin binding hemagglutinin HbhA
VIIMAVELPTAADVRKARHNVAKTAAQGAEAARTPLLAVLGAGDMAVTAVTKAVAEARTRTEGVQHRLAGLKGEELRKAVAELRTHAEQAYAGFAEQGERTWGRIRTQPQVKEALARLETYTEKLDARVDDLVDDAHDAAEKALVVLSTQTRSTGERVARASQRFSGRAAQGVTDTAADTTETIRQAGTKAAAETRSATRKAANRTAPTAGANKPPTRRTGTANGDKPSS